MTPYESVNAITYQLNHKHDSYDYFNKHRIRIKLCKEKTNLESYLSNAPESNDCVSHGCHDIDCT